MMSSIYVRSYCTKESSGPWAKCNYGIQAKRNYLFPLRFVVYLSVCFNPLMPETRVSCAVKLHMYGETHLERKKNGKSLVIFTACKMFHRNNCWEKKN